MQDNLEIQNLDTAYNALIEQITEMVRQSRDFPSIAWNFHCSS